MKNKTIFIILGVFLLITALGVGLYFFLKKDEPAGNKDAKSDSPTNSSTGTTSNSSTGTTSNDSTGTTSNSSTNMVAPNAPPPQTIELKKGNSGAEVKTLQSLLNKTMNAARAASPLNVPAAISEDGSFGTNTEKALLFCTDKRTTSLFDYNKNVLGVAQSGTMRLTAAQKQAMAQSVGGIATTLNPLSWFAAPSTSSNTTTAPTNLNNLQYSWNP
jgi:hypothetical protein